LDSLAVADVLEAESPQVLKEDMISSPPSEAEEEAKEDTGAESWECSICFDEKHMDNFPKVTETYDCEADACRECVQL
jgi:hypothetical protein